MCAMVGGPRWISGDSYKPLANSPLDFWSFEQPAVLARSFELETEWLSHSRIWWLEVKDCSGRQSVVELRGEHFTDLGFHN